MVCVHLDGFSGVGKTSLCRRLATRFRGEVECVDVDEHGWRPPPTSPRVVLYAGMQTPPGSLRMDHRVVLRPDDVEETYRRFLLRNLENVVRHADAIRDTIDKTEPASRIADGVLGLRANFALVVRLPWYRAWVREHSRAATARGYKAMSAGRFEAFVANLVRR
jgi:hypothetical protein